MVPGFALRIQSMIRAMREVVIPAIPPDQRLALDQANILVGNLRIMAEQHDRIFQYELTELREYARLLADLIEAAGSRDTAEARAVLARAEPVAAAAIPTQPELAALVRQLKAAADALLQAAHRDGSPDFRKAASELVMRQAEAQILRERRWLRAAGFELDPESLPSLDQLLGG